MTNETPANLSCSCQCSAGPKLIFSCSGAADVGAVDEIKTMLG